MAATAAAAELPTTPRVYTVSEGEVVSVRKGPSDQADVVSELASGTVFAVGDYAKKGRTEEAAWGKYMGDVNGFVVTPIAKDGASAAMRYTGSPPEVDCVVCGTKMDWADWQKHKRAKKHKSKYDKNCYAEDVCESLDVANQLLERSALSADPSIAEKLKIAEVVPQEGFGRWAGPPPSAKKEKEKEKDAAGEEKPKKKKKKRGGKKKSGSGDDGEGDAEEVEEKEEAAPLTEDQMAWLQKAAHRRETFTADTRGYNEGFLTSSIARGPDSVPAFGAGRGRLL
eukprot:TRINITY_DN2504_c0_g3_i1.p1 TRINITY_DN2504_c0_g3~~TRINITY_DN2504_c0_g3_i1.p1  ORF type:complete len:323 (+),score=113.38 TRINITY_DN2504_c0_g3_i1:121-969(+)